MADTFAVKKNVFERVRQDKRLLFVSLGILLALALLALVAAYQWTLGPRDRDSTEKIRVVVASGETVSDIANKLKENDLIKSETSFRIYAELSNTKSRLQAGGYALSKSLSVPDIIDHMSTGKTDEFNVRVVPGLTLKQQYDQDLEGSFAQQGFSADEITEAFNQTYTSDVLSKRPSGATLEGYIYPDTYRITADSSVSAVIQKSLDEFARVLQENTIEQRLSERGMTLHQGITLASIIQKEVSKEQDQRQVAQVFHKRLAEGIMLGSDVTFLYAAELLGVEPTIRLDSPYNTRVNTGLPPGPIANFNLSALLAVVDPAPGDYLYFVSDNDQNTYYARTLEEHEANVERYNRQSRTEFSY